MIVDQLEEALVRGERPKFVYTVPNFGNPAGVTMSLPRRQQLVALCREAGIPIIEDNPYGLLRFEGDALPCLRSMDPENVIYLGTVSKVFSPGVRVGWALAEQSVVQRLVLAKEAADLCGSSFTMLVTERYFAGDRWRENLHAFVDLYRSAATRCSRPSPSTSRPTPRGRTRRRVLRVGDPARHGLTRKRCWPPRSNDASRTSPARRSIRTAGGEPDAAGVLLSDRGSDPRGHRSSGRAARGRRAALPFPAPMRVAVLAGGRTPERDVSLRSGHRVSQALVEGRPRRLARRPGRGAAGRGARRNARPTSATSRCTARKARTARCSGCWTSWGSRTREPRRSTARSRSTRSWRRTRWCAPGSAPPNGRGRGLGVARPRRRRRAVAGHGPCGPPCVVKPSRAGSALGVGFVERASDLAAAVMAALSFAAAAAIVEAKVEGSEVAVGVVGTAARRRSRWSRSCRRAGCSTTPPAIRPEPPSTSRRRGSRQESRPPAPSEALRAAQGLHLRDVARVDAIVDADGRPWVLEVNVSPGMTETSLLPMAAQAAGWTLTELCERVLRSSASHATAL